MAAVANTSTRDYNIFKDSIKNLSTQELEKLYSRFRDGHEARSYMTMALAVSLLVLSILPALSGNFVLAIGLSVLSIALGIYSYLQIHKNDLEQNVIEDLFRERGKQAIFQVYQAGFGGYSLQIIDITH